MCIDDTRIRKKNVSIRPLQFSLIYSPANVMSGRERKKEKEKEYFVCSIFAMGNDHIENQVCMYAKQIW